MGKADCESEVFASASLCSVLCACEEMVFLGVFKRRGLFWMRWEVWLLRGGEVGGGRFGC